jgi:thymidylate synthase ThyX
MVIEAKVVLDSISEQGVRLLTFELTYPRFIHAEFMTHRVFSRNAASSRAIPVKKMIENISNQPAMPIYWGENKPGMQAGEEIKDVDAAKAIWLESAKLACAQAEKMLALNVHKQVVNRLTEPFMHMKTLVTATEWDNWFTLRDHTDAQPEIRELAIQMRLAMDASTPTKLGYDEWHLPYIREEEKYLDQNLLLQISTARCARVSYLTHDGQSPDWTKDKALYDRLITSKPIHASPAEHQAKPLKTESVWPDEQWSGNFRGWVQHRKLIEGEF